MIFLLFVTDFTFNNLLDSPYSERAAKVQYSPSVLYSAGDEEKVNSLIIVYVWKGWD